MSEGQNDRADPFLIDRENALKVRELAQTIWEKAKGDEDSATIGLALANVLQKIALSRHPGQSLKYAIDILENVRGQLQL